MHTKENTQLIADTVAVVKRMESLGFRWSNRAQAFVAFRSAPRATDITNRKGIRSAGANSVRAARLATRNRVSSLVTAHTAAIAQGGEAPAVRGDSVITGVDLRTGKVVSV